LPEALRKGQPRHAAGGFLLARLATDKDLQGEASAASSCSPLENAACVSRMKAAES